MPITWTPENNAKLFLAVLEQLKDHKIKLDNKKLAEYMGPDCTVRSIDNQIFKLRKQATQDPSSNSNDQSLDASAPATPAATPKKRSSATPKKSTPAKKKKAEQQVDMEETGSEEEDRIMKEVQDELKDLKD
ncbi:uncharacterized protein BJX67DRAFT_383164 [Aspergillus lucknowensis]|uniref:Uncharacterized protein n=1 Tax=Aspergillus lucknowensis TaxID=176173 RepID=A0ABR4LLC2_9EURO